MATDVSILQKNLNDAIKKSLQENPEVNGLVYVSYDNKDLGISEDNLPVNA
jgi:hypothetical protein